MVAGGDPADGPAGQLCGGAHGLAGLEGGPHDPQGPLLAELAVRGSGGEEGVAFTLPLALFTSGPFLFTAGLLLSLAAGLLGGLALTLFTLAFTAFTFGLLAFMLTLLLFTSGLLAVGSLAGQAGLVLALGLALQAGLLGLFTLDRKSVV